MVFGSGLLTTFILNLAVTPHAFKFSSSLVLYVGLDLYSHLDSNNYLFAYFNFVRETSDIGVIFLIIDI